MHANTLPAAARQAEPRRIDKIEFNKLRARFMARVSAPEISALALKLAYVIAYKRMNTETRVLFIDQRELCREIGIGDHPRTIRRLLPILQRCGLSIEPGLGRGNASTYRIDVEGDEKGTVESSFKSEKGTPESAFEEEKGTFETPKRGPGRHVKGDPTAPPSKEDSKEESKQQQRAREESADEGTKAKLDRLEQPQPPSVGATWCVAIIAEFTKAGYPDAKLPDTGTGHVEEWLAAGYHLETVIGEIRRIVARKKDVGTLTYFDKPIAEAHARRNAANGHANASTANKEPTDADWEFRVNAFKRGGTWFQDWGGTPDSFGCDAPAHLLTEWAAKKRATLEKIVRQDEEYWKEYYYGFLKNGQWSDRCGPPPDSPKCWIPPDLIEKWSQEQRP
jgi:hypothetical protein